MTAPQIFLLVFLWMDGAWVPGWDVPGFNPRPQDSITECLERAETLNQSSLKVAVELGDGSLKTVEHFRGRCFVIYPMQEIKK